MPQPNTQTDIGLKLIALLFFASVLITSTERINVENYIDSLEYIKTNKRILITKKPSRNFFADLK